MLFPALPFPFERVVGGVKAITLRDGVKEDEIVWTSRGTTVSPFSSLSYCFFESTASWDKGSFFIPLMRAYFFLLYLVAISANKKREVSDHIEWWKNLQGWTYSFPLDESFLTCNSKAAIKQATRVNQIVKILDLLVKSKGSSNPFMVLVLQFRMNRNYKDQEINNIIHATIWWRN